MYLRFDGLDQADMDHSHHALKNRQKRRFNNHQNISPADIGWRDMCAPDCNGVVQNLDDPNKTCKCFFSQSGVYRNPNEDDFPRNGLPFPEFAFPENQSSIACPESTVNNTSFQNTTPFVKECYNTWKMNNENKSRTFIDKTNCINEPKENIIQKPIISKAVGTPVSYFSDKSTFDFATTERISTKIEFKDSFTLFPDKTTSSPSVMDGLGSYFKKDSQVRTRCVSDSQTKLNMDPQVRTRCVSDSQTKLNMDPPTRFRMLSLPNSSFENNGIEQEMEGSTIIKFENAAENGFEPAEKECFGLKTPTIGEVMCTNSNGAHSSYHADPETRPFQDVQSIENQFQLNTSEELGYFEKLRLEEYKKEAAEIEYFKKNGLGSSAVKQSAMIENANDFYYLQSLMKKTLHINLKDPIWNPAAEIAKVKWADMVEPYQAKPSVGRNKNNFLQVSFSNRIQENGKRKDYRKNNQELECKFCKSNLEVQQLYMSHNLKERIGKRTVVTCPVLRKLVCERCGATGDNAHTYSYCPVVINETGRRPMSVASELKKTKHVASGRMRKHY